MARLQQVILVALTIPLGCIAYRSMSPRGVLFSVRNATESPIALRCDGVRMDTPVILPKRDILILPRDLSKCTFSDGRTPWRYPFDAASADLSALRRYGFRRDSHDPYLCIFEIQADRSLHTKPGSGPLAGFPIAAETIPGDALVSESEAVRVYLHSGRPRDAWYFSLTPSGRVLLYDYQTTTEMSLSSSAVSALLRELEACELCGLNASLPKAEFSAHQMTVVLQPDEECRATLAWDAWQSDVETRNGARLMCAPRCRPHPITDSFHQQPLLQDLIGGNVSLFDSNLIRFSSAVGDGLHVPSR